MITGISIVVIIIFSVLFLIAKREAVHRLFSNRISSSTRELQNELESTADRVLKQMENHISQLEYLIAEADEKILSLDKKVKSANQLIRDLHNLDNSTLLDSKKTENLANIHFEEKHEKPLTFNEYVALDESSSQNSDPKTMNRETIGEDKKRLIAAMAEQGYNVTEIAKATGMGKGAIMLVLQLHKK
ncbi:hypothetical protein SPFL3102_00519 [Sporomusaceae bacterium FL31]|nr:hypothetical protein SPFL3101_01553 [Sporomusaceae bacterium FL31]GCE32723.1 hypothetical protein SPFL3102_00519 [Sporomusaceae bacterium]